MLRMLGAMVGVTLVLAVTYLFLLSLVWFGGLQEKLFRFLWRKIRPTFQRAN